MKTIQQMWEDYQRTCVPATASAGQVAATHQAFMAGFITGYDVMFKVADGTLPEDRAIAFAESIKAQIDQYTAAKRTRGLH